MKLALLALVLGVGACVAEDSSVERLEATDTVGPINVVNEVEIPTVGATNIDFAVVTITGVEIPGRIPTSPNIDITNVDYAELEPEARQLCALADELPVDNVCSSLCNPVGFAARVFDQGSPGGCKQTTCELPGDVTVNLDLCTPSN